ncbi:hypothetical protein [Candidatus Electronema sp. JM]|uniref:hypothetical protein n=1 Tax=Candidatus Electronema sp. JM TaxID=3401571 RepID=UPI003AA97E0A
MEGLANNLSQNMPKNVRQLGIATVLQALDDTEAEVRFWACFAASSLYFKEALPKLRVLAQTDTAIVPGWWSVGQEAEDAAAMICTGEVVYRERS